MPTAYSWGFSIFALYVLIDIGLIILSYNLLCECMKLANQSRLLLQT